MKSRRFLICYERKALDAREETTMLGYQHVYSKTLSGAIRQLFANYPIINIYCVWEV